jgi:hypothetical protein
MRCCTPHQQEHTHNHANRPGDEKHDWHLPGHDLEVARCTAPCLFPPTPLAKELMDIGQSIAVR